ncbi:MAG TPA: anti-sigma factor [Acidimicrobiales bacterium]|nr:anti-sigma factor [Acidimicrobiales bacterium]
MELRHSDIEELLGAYALDAVDPDEAELVEVHLRDCARCRAEVAEHREVAAALAHAGSSAPHGLWNRIAAGLEEETPPALDMTRVVPMRPPRRRSVPAIVAAAVAAVAAVVIAVLGVQVSHLNDRTDTLRAALDHQGLDQAVQAALLDPAARRVDMRSTSGAVVAQAVLRPGGEAYLVGNRLPALAADRTYQLWAIVGGKPVSLSVLGNEPGVKGFTLAGGGATALALTDERSGGVEAPTSKPIVQGLLPA